MLSKELKDYIAPAIQKLNIYLKMQSSKSWIFASSSKKRNAAGIIYDINNFIEISCR